MHICLHTQYQNIMLDVGGTQRMVDQQQKYFVVVPS